MVLCCVVLAACSPAPPRPRDPVRRLGATLVRPLPEDVARLRLVADDGRTTTLSSLRGHPVLLADTMTQCQEACPLITANLRRTAEVIAADRSLPPLRYVEITVDPARDDPAHLRAYRAQFGVGRDWSFLTGSPAAIARVWRFFGVGTTRTTTDDPGARDWMTGRPLTYDVTHTDAVVLLDGDLRERFVLVGGARTDATRLPATLHRFLNGEGRDNLAHPDAAAWTPRQLAEAVRWVLAGRRS